MNWGDDGDDDAFGAADFLAQLEAEQYQQGISTINLGAFEGADDELALSDMSSSDNSDEDDADAEDLLDLDEEDDLIDRMSWFKRVSNRLSKPRYLKKYFLAAIVAQVLLYIALVVSQAAIGQTNQTIFLIVVAAMLLAAQSAQGKKHFSEKATSLVEMDVGTADSEDVFKLRARLLWHGKMIIYPCIVSVFCTLIYFIGIFTVLFHYATKTNSYCASGPVEMIESLQGHGLLFIGWFTAAYVPILAIFFTLSMTHFRAHTDVDKNLQHILQALNKDKVEKTSGSSVDDARRTVLNGGWIRENYAVTLVLQVLLYAILFFSRFMPRPRPDNCADLHDECVIWARLGLCSNGGGTGKDEAADYCSCDYAANGHCDYPTLCHAGTDNLDCQLNQTIPGWCFHQHEIGTHMEIKNRICCNSCSGTQIEQGFGSLYVICVLGACFLGYDSGFLSSYMIRGKVFRAKEDDLIETRFKRRWHARHILYPCVKCILMTGLYFVTILSLVYNFRQSEDICPQSVFETIEQLSGRGFLLCVTVTVITIPTIVAELLLCQTHFRLYREYSERYFAELTRTGLGAAMDRYARLQAVLRAKRAQARVQDSTETTLNPINQLRRQQDTPIPNENRIKQAPYPSVPPRYNGDQQPHNQTMHVDEM